MASDTSKKDPFGMVAKSETCSKALSDSEFRVLAYIRTEAHGSWTALTAELIAKDMHCSVRTIERVLPKLHKSGLFQSRRRGCGLPTEYFAPAGMLRTRERAEKSCKMCHALVKKFARTGVCHRCDREGFYVGGVDKLPDATFEELALARSLQGKTADRAAYNRAKVIAANNKKKDPVQ